MYTLSHTLTNTHTRKSKWWWPAFNKMTLSHWPIAMGENIDTNMLGYSFWTIYRIVLTISIVIILYREVPGNSQPYRITHTNAHTHTSISHSQRPRGDDWPSWGQSSQQEQPAGDRAEVRSTLICVLRGSRSADRWRSCHGLDWTVLLCISHTPSMWWELAIATATATATVPLIGRGQEETQR